MKDGTYRVHFSTPNGAVGGGMVKVVGGVIFGADCGFMYSGTTNRDGSNVRGVIEVQRHSQGRRSVIENVNQNYSIEVAGESTDDSFHLRGSVVGAPSSLIGIVGWLQNNGR